MAILGVENYVPSKRWVMWKDNWSSLLARSMMSCTPNDESFKDKKALKLQKHTCAKSKYNRQGRAETRSLPTENQRATRFQKTEESGQVRTKSIHRQRFRFFHVSTGNSFYSKSQ